MQFTKKTCNRTGNYRKTFVKLINKAIIYKFFKNSKNHRTKANKVVVLSIRLLPNILECKNHRSANNLENNESFGNILKSLANMYENSGSQFFETSAGIQSVQDAFDKSRLFMAFSTNFGNTWILYSYRLVLEGRVQQLAYIMYFCWHDFGHASVYFSKIFKIFLIAIILFHLKTYCYMFDLCLFAVGETDSLLLTLKRPYFSNISPYIRLLANLGCQ